MLNRGSSFWKIKNNWPKLRLTQSTLISNSCKRLGSPNTLRLCVWITCFVLKTESRSYRLLTIILTYIHVVKKTFILICNRFRAIICVCVCVCILASMIFSWLNTALMFLRRLSPIISNHVRRPWGTRESPSRLASKCCIPHTQRVLVMPRPRKPERLGQNIRTSLSLKPETRSSWRKSVGSTVGWIIERFSVSEVSAKRRWKRKLLIYIGHTYT